jgi:putative FmdB family regulatory protein
MPIYEFACPKCRVIFNFFYKRPEPDRLPKCPKCGNKRMVKEMSRFAVSRGGSGKKSSGGDESGEGDMPDFDDPRIERAFGELEKELGSVDESNPKHLAHVMRKMKDLMPPGSLPKELDTAIRRLEAGEDPEKIEEDMGDVFGDAMGPGSSKGGGYTRDDGLYDFE